MHVFYTEFKMLLAKICFFCQITQNIGPLELNNVLKTYRNIIALLILSYRTAFYDVHRPIYAILGRRDMGEKWSGHRSKNLKMAHGPTGPPSQNVISTDPLT